MAKEGAGKAEETERMIEKEAPEGSSGANEANVGHNNSGGGGVQKAGDAKEMRAVVLSAFGGHNKFRVSKKVMPERQEGELKICVKAGSFPPFDLMGKTGILGNGQEAHSYIGDSFNSNISTRVREEGSKPSLEKKEPCSPPFFLQILLQSSSSISRGGEGEFDRKPPPLILAIGAFLNHHGERAFLKKKHLNKQTGILPKL